MPPDGKKSANRRKYAQYCWLEGPLLSQTIVLAFGTTDALLSDGCPFSSPSRLKVILLTQIN